MPRHPALRTPLPGRLAARLACLVIGLLVVTSAGLAQEEASAESETYRLVPGDRIQVEVQRHEDLSGEFTLDGSGRFQMPLIGKVDANGLTTDELAERLVAELKPDYLVDPRVTVWVNNYRPYYMMGEVGKTGAFAYREGMTYLEAIVLAGGYSYRARKDVVYVIRAGRDHDDELRLDVNEKVQPGDIIRIAERLF